ncbi:MAG: hypothetical protein HRT44_13685, partial [Bdellovibrionales bacterium]|nr:hypothetical protein [Bdellovibrionales bacterium]
MRQRIYRSEDIPPSWSEVFVSSLHTVGFETPLYLTALQDVMTFFPQREVTRIANDFKRLYASSWKRVECASLNVKEHLSRFGYDRFGTFNTYCMTHAEAFDRVFKELNIPRSSSGFVAANSTGADGVTRHVANRVTVTDVNGQSYGYVIDVG